MNTLKAEKRNQKAKALRREGYVIGNLSGREIEGSIPVKMVQSDITELFKTCNKGSQIYLDVEGTKYDALIKTVDYDPVKKMVMDIEFQALVSNEKIHNVAEIILCNEEKVTEGVLEELLEEVSYKAYPKDLVDKVIVDAGTMRVGDTVRVRDLDIAKNPNIELLTDLDAIVVNVIASKNVATDDDAEEEGEAEK